MTMTPWRGPCQPLPSSVPFRRILDGHYVCPPQPSPGTHPKHSLSILCISPQMGGEKQLWCQLIHASMAWPVVHGAKDPKLR